MSVSDAWEQHAQQWIAWARESLHDGFWSGTWPTLKGLLPQANGLTVDLGCGEGRAGRELTAVGHEVIGIDRSPTLLNAALGRAPRYPVVRGDMTSLPFPDGLAALVVASCSLQDVDDLDVALREAARILGPGGVLCAAIVHPFSSAEDVTTIQTDEYVVSEPYLQPRRYEVDFDRDRQTMRFVSMHHPLHAYVNGLAAAGLLIEEMREFGEGNIPWLLAFRAHKRS